MNDESLNDAQLRALARELGAGAAGRVDSERTAQAVLRRLREQPRGARRPQSLGAWLSLAAAVVLLLGGGLVWQSGQRTAGHAPAAALAPASLDLNALSPDQLRAVLNAVDEPLDLEASGSDEAGLDDLTPRELRRLLRALEG